MTIKEINKKVNYLQENHFGEWLSTRQKVENEISDNQSVFCVCGRLATGLHESHCGKFRTKVNQKTVERLEYLTTSNEKE